MCHCPFGWPWCTAVFNSCQRHYGVKWINAVHQEKSPMPFFDAVLIKETPRLSGLLLWFLNILRGRCSSLLSHYTQTCGWFQSSSLRDPASATAKQLLFVEIWSLCYIYHVIQIQPATEVIKILNNSLTYWQHINAISFLDLGRNRPMFEKHAILKHFFFFQPWWKRIDVEGG